MSSMAANQSSPAPHHTSGTGASTAPTGGHHSDAAPAQENGYTFRMGDHEVTMRDSFASMLDTTQLTDCLLVCHSPLNKDDNAGDSADCLLVCHSPLNKDDNAGDSAGADSASHGLTNGHHRDHSPSPALSLTDPKNGVGVSGHTLHTHRVILSASSDYFRAIFSTLTAQPLGVVAVVVTNVDFDDLKSIVDFIYKGQVSVGQSRIHKFLAAAQTLMVKGLMNIKLVSNDNQGSDEGGNGAAGGDSSSADDQHVQRLRSEKRSLEHEIRTLREHERSRKERLRREIETEMKKKLELEKSVLNEEKQRFEAMRMKFSIEREVYEKTRAKELSNKCLNNGNTNSVNSNQLVNNKVVNNNNSYNNVIEFSDNTNHIETNGTGITITTHRSPGLRVEHQPIQQSQLPHRLVITGGHIVRQQIVSPKREDTKIPESPGSEGRQLRKRIKLGTDGSANDAGGHESVIKVNKSDVSDMEVDESSGLKPLITGAADRHDVDEEEDDGEVYEIDFSQPLETQHFKHHSSAGKDQMNDLKVNPQSAAIVASTLAYHKMTTATTTTSSSTVTASPATTAAAINTRALRRSTSSHGSQNGHHSDGHTIGTEVVNTVRRKGPGRTPNWAKEAEMNSDLDGTPDTRSGRKQRASQEYVMSPAGGAQQQSSSGLYQCPYCPQVYHGHQSMQDHINGVHLNAKTQYVCDYCGKVYTWRISLNKHLKTVHPNEPILD
ncbi:unnamed protein product [Medioppia subpectinata]|uniref:Uncharacterized protein n=1 Tax=Medioppia subpectinata TaxID=1979941 RepID=A0A7R9Q1G2_9ACAR|nr:unnamed protein product [Medioppia subpectinata]CAG2109062.1 unnamed protein product [Medioppia subpectinata]